MVAVVFTAVSLTPGLGEQGSRVESAYTSMCIGEVRAGFLEAVRPAG